MEYSGIEIHTLICNKDLLLAINNFKSLQKLIRNLPQNNVNVVSIYMRGYSCSRRS